MNLISSYKRKGGFTLIEVIIVIAILAILAAAMAPNLSWFIKDATEEEMIAQGKVVLINIEDEVADLRKTSLRTGKELQDLVDEKKADILSLSDLTSDVDINSFVIEIENRQLDYFEFSLDEKYVCYNNGEIYINEVSEAGKN